MAQVFPKVGVYEKLGVRTLINAAGTLTRCGGVPLPREVVEAMAEASRACVRMEDLEDAAGLVIAEATGAEAGYVTAGAAAGLTLSAAACMAGLDVAKLDQLPDTTGMRNEIVVQRAHRNAYDHAIRASGATFVEVGYLGYPGAGGTYAWQIESAIGPKTAAIFWATIQAAGVVSLKETCELAHRHNLPVIVDASASLPPFSNLRRFVDEGADLVNFSGGKAIMGPQNTGILAGRRDLVEIVALMHQDQDVNPETWSRREKYLTSGRLPGPPHQGFGRGFKVGKEEIVGLVTALQLYVQRDHAADRRRWDAIVERVSAGLAGLPHIATSITDASYPIPRVVIQLHEEKLGFTAADVVNRLYAGTPQLAVSEGLIHDGIISINPMGLLDDQIAPMIERLRAVLSGK